MSEEKTSPPSHQEVVRWFTRARKFPQLIGRTPDGTRIPGGPYTPTQAVGGGLVFFIGAKTINSWAHFGLVMNGALLLAITAAVVWGLGRTPLGHRNPLSILTGYYRAFTAPQHGHLAGRPVSLSRPRRVRHRVILPVTDLPDIVLPPPPARVPSAPEADTPVVPEPSSAFPAAGPRKPALTGVQALLATKSSTNTQETD